MTSSDWMGPILDPLYGEIRLDEPMLALARTPTIQRMRHVRLSNIDSLDLPSIANLSRYEHVLGVAHLATNAGFRNRLSPLEDLTFRGAALLHDWAITSYGHLVEEALQYVGTTFSHEEKLARLGAYDGDGDVGGRELQILHGRESGLEGWALKYAGPRAEVLITGIVQMIGGRGPWSGAIAGTIDLDNIDNVCRMAYHMGKSNARDLPLALATAMVASDPVSGAIGFRRSAGNLIEGWLEVRRWVYERLMLSPRDFAGKLMLLHATVTAYQAGEIHADDWKLVDHEFIERLVDSRQRIVSDTAKRWLTGELWTTTDLSWMSGSRPDYPRLLEVSEEMGRRLGRPCFVYAIKDKRDRRLSIMFDDGSREEFGSNSERWLVGMGSPVGILETADLRLLTGTLKERFGTERLTLASRHEDAAQGTLF